MKNKQVQNRKRLHVVLFLTWDVSLALWQEKGLLQREVRLYQELSKRGVDVTFLSWGGAEDKALAESLAPAIRTVSLYNYIPRPKNKILRGLCSLLAPFAVRKTLKTADILKTNQMWGGWVAVLAKMITRKPLMVRCGFELYDFTVKQGHKGFRRFFVWCISRLTYGAADRICVAAQEDKDFVIEHFDQKAAKIALHPNWIDADIFAPMDRPQKDKRVLFVGRLSAQKNLEMLIDALAGTGITLDIAGNGELRQALEKQATEKKVSVNFLGSVPNDRLPEIYNSYPVFILPSHYEGNPKTLLEAMSCGRAVIGTDVPGIASVIHNGDSGLLCALDEQEMRVTITRLMGDADLQKRLGQKARQQILENQTLDRLASMELACYRELTGQKI